jgi:hypothetical protein
MALEPEKNSDKQAKPDRDDDWENCKGQCGYTPWCRDCKTPETIQKK